LLDSAQTLLAGLLALGRTRLELFSTELQEEMARQAAALLGAMAVMALALLAAAFAALALVLLVEEGQRAGAALGVAALFALLAAAGVWMLRRLAAAKPRAFDASLAQLERDYETIQP
jgi:uncharacterized membrane protein YqjE